MECEHSMESYWTVLYCGTVSFTIQCGSNFFICGSNHGVWTFYGKLLNSTVLWYCLFYYTVLFKIFHMWIKPWSVNILWKATEQYCTVIQYVLLYSVVLTFSSVLYCGTVCFTIQCGFNFFICGSNHGVWTFYGKLLNSTVLWYCLFYYTVLFKIFHMWIKPWSVNILWKATEQYCTVIQYVLLYSVVLTFSSVLYCGTVCFTIQCGSNFFICGSNHGVWTFYGKLLNSTVLWYSMFYYTAWF